MDDPRPQKPPGLPPGTLIHVGERKTERSRITVIEYGPDGCEDREGVDVTDIPEPGAGAGVVWINVDGIHEVPVIESLGKRFGIHPLTLEDVLNTGQRSKIEDYETYLFMVVKMIDINPRTQELRAEQISMILGEGLLITFQEIPGDVFEAVRERIRRGRGRIRSSGGDYLAYALIDALVDRYVEVMETLAERVEDLEDAVLSSDPPADVLESIHGMKRQMLLFRRRVWPIREIVNALKKEGPPLVQESTVIYLGDVHDHAIGVIDGIESCRDILSGMLDLHLSTMSNRMNEVMKVLTMIATIFIPLTFLAGIYGMNFQYMPELGWRWGYFGIWGVMVAVAGAMLIYFKRKDWF